jgi:hypothetical protein
MSEKVIHIVFQVLNFLSQDISTQFKLTADEQLLLIFLSKHKGHKGIYPSVVTLARELKRSESAIRRSLTRLRKKQLILIDYVPGKSSNYKLLIPSLDLSTTPSVDATTTLSTPLASTLGQSRRTRQDTPSVDARQSERGNKTKEINRRGRHKKHAAPFPVDFMINPKSEKLIDELGLDEDDTNEIINKFVDYYSAKHQTSDDWNRMLQIWIEREMKFRKERAEKKRLSEPEEKPWYHKENENVPRGNGMAVLGEIIQKLKTKPNGHGGHTNGLGSERKGED